MTQYKIIDPETEFIKNIKNQEKVTITLSFIQEFNIKDDEEEKITLESYNFDFTDEENKTTFTIKSKTIPEIDEKVQKTLKELFQINKNLNIIDKHDYVNVKFNNPNNTQYEKEFNTPTPAYILRRKDFTGITEDELDEEYVL